MSIIIEEWRVVPGTDGKLEASSIGRIRSWRRSGGGVLDTPRIVGSDSEGYRRVNTTVRGVTRPYLVHQLVAMAFHGPPPPGCTDVRHLDGDGMNNHPGNLAWGTRAENESDKVRHGRSNQGERQGRSKLVEDKVRDIRRMYAAGGLSQQKLAEKYGVTRTTIQAIVERRIWKHINEEG